MAHQKDPPLHERIKQLMREHAAKPLHELLAESEPVELSGALFHFTGQEQRFLVEMMGDDGAAELLPVLSEPTLLSLLPQIPDDHLQDLLEEMEPDDAAQVIAFLEPGRAAAVLAALEPARRKDLTNLLSYGEETAGRIMDPDLVRVKAAQSVGEALEDIRRYVEQVDLDEFFSIYVVDETGVLLGVIPVWKMLLAQSDETVRGLMTTGVVSVIADMDQEQVSRIVRDRDLVSVPVVDHRQRLIGRITVDDVVDVIHDEFAEDVAQLVGAGARDVTDLSIRASIRHRSPWLLFALGGLFVSALIMHRFEEFFVAMPQLAFFIPLVMAMGGNTGIQSSSLVIRGLATGEVRLDQYWRRMRRELGVSLGIGVLFAVLLIGAVGLLTGDWRIGFTVGLATAAGIAAAALIGTTIPMALERIDLDPALATGPFLTTVNDILGIAVYLALAFWILF